MDTGDANDFSFYPTGFGVGTDKFIIARGRAMLGFNRTTGSDFPLRGVLDATTIGTNPSPDNTIPLEITIISGATTLAATAIAMSASLLF